MCGKESGGPVEFLSNRPIGLGFSGPPKLKGTRCDTDFESKHQSVETWNILKHLETVENNFETKQLGMRHQTSCTCEGHQICDRLAASWILANWLRTDREMLVEYQNYQRECANMCNLLAKVQSCIQSLKISQVEQPTPSRSRLQGWQYILAKNGKTTALQYIKLPTASEMLHRLWNAFGTGQVWTAVGALGLLSMTQTNSSRVRRFCTWKGSWDWERSVWNICQVVPSRQRQLYPANSCERASTVLSWFITSELSGFWMLLSAMQKAVSFFGSIFKTGSCFH